MRAPCLSPSVIPPKSVAAIEQTAGPFRRLLHGGATCSRVRDRSNQGSALWCRLQSLHLGSDSVHTMDVRPSMAITQGRACHGKYGQLFRGNKR